MIQNLGICHIPKSLAGNFEGPADFFHDLQAGGNYGCDSRDWLLFETCQRQIFISVDPLNSINSSDGMSRFCGGKFYRGQEAYEKLLSVLCGLESRILAETEVFGQFKNFTATLPANSRFKRIAHDLILDVRELRKTCLDGIGLRSYGSISAHYVKNLEYISLIGGGQLAQKILPYLTEGNHKISLHLRSPSKSQRLPERLRKNIKICALDDPGGFDQLEGLIVAAPVASSKIENWLQVSGSSPEVIVDLRDQGPGLRLDGSVTIVTLNDLFERMEKTSDLLLRKVAKARDEVGVLSRRRFSARHFRPFGWEDICA